MLQGEDLTLAYQDGDRTLERCPRGLDLHRGSPVIGILGPSALAKARYCTC